MDKTHKSGRDRARNEKERLSFDEHPKLDDMAVSMKKSEALSILGLQEGATADEIKAAHRKKVRESHPDRFAQDPMKKAQAEERTKLINEARDVLESGKWDPEGPFNPYGNANPYAGNPFYPQGNPYTQQRPGQTTYEWGGGTWTVWTSPGAGGTYDPFNPFSAQASSTATAKRAFEIAQSNFRSSLASLAVILLLCGVCIVRGNYFSAAVVFGLMVAMNMLVTRIGGCMWIMALPVIFYAIEVAMAAPGVQIGLGQLIFGGVIFVVMLMAEIRDLIRIYRHLKTTKAEYEKKLAEDQEQAAQE